MKGSPQPTLEARLPEAVAVMAPDKSNSCAAASSSAAGAVTGPALGPSGVGFNRWMRERRAQGDTLPLTCYLVFLCSVLLQQGRTLPTPYLLYYIGMTAMVITLLAWRLSGAPSYPQWRDWVHGAIRVDVFFNPAQLYLMQRSWAADASPNRLAALPQIILNSGTVQLFVHSFMHCISLPCQLLLQTLCTVRAVVGVCAQTWQQMPFCQHPNTQHWFAELNGWLQETLGVFSLRPLALPRDPAPVQLPTQSCQVVVMVVAYLGFVAPIALQAVLERRLYHAYCSTQQQRHPRQHLQLAPRGHPVSACAAAADRLLDSCSAVLVPLLGFLATCPTVLLLLAVALWDVLSIIFL